MKKTYLKRKPLKRKFKPPDVEGIEKMNEFFRGIWRKRPHVSEISGEKLLNPPKTYYFHHIIPKSNSKYGRLAIYDEENIIFLTFEEHTAVEQDMYKYELINKRREKLLEKYETKESN